MRRLGCIAGGLGLLWACGREAPRPERGAGPERVREAPAPRPRERPAPDPERGAGPPRGVDGAWFVPHARISTTFPRTDKRGRPLAGRPEQRGGEAVAVLDADGDGRQDVVIVNGSDHAVVALNRPGPEGPRFVDRAFLVGEADDGLSHRPKGLGVHDLDGDGRLDLYLATQGRGGRVTYKRDPPNDKGLYRDAGFSTWRSTGDGTFAPVDVGLDGAGSKRTMVFGDVDRDGHVDAFLSVSSYYGIWYAGAPESAQFFPGRDGGWGPDALADVFDTPDGFWTDAEGRSVKNLKAAVLRDLDGDGLPDLVVGGIADLWANHELDTTDPAEDGWQGAWDRGLFFFHNRSTPGAPRFAEVGHEATQDPWGHEGQGHVHSVVALDLDHDGDLDLFVSGNKGPMSHNTLEHGSPIVRVFRNDSVPGVLRFVDVSDEAGVGFLNGEEGLPAPYPMDVTLFGQDVRYFPALMAAAPGDVDGDGHMDVIAVDRQTIGEDPESGEDYDLHAYVFRGDGAGHLSLVPLGTHGLVGTARDLSVGDFDADGRLDVVFVDGSTGGQYVSDRNTVFLNRHEGGGGFWLRVDLPGNRFGIGTRVTVRDGDGVVFVDELRTDFSYRSKRDAALHVGVGSRSRVDVHLAFPDGVAAVVDDLPARGAWTIARTEVVSDGSRWALRGAGPVVVEDVDRGTVRLGGRPERPKGLEDVDGDGRADLVLSRAPRPGETVQAVVGEDVVAVGVATGSDAR